MKKVGQCLYIHKSALDTLKESYQQTIIDEVKLLPSDFIDYQIIKLDTKTGAVSFIKSPDWDLANEPTVGDSCKIKGDKITVTKSKGQIYHHKWSFVKPDYKGFDVNESKKRSELWQSKIPQTKEIKSRIGYRTYWNQLLKEHDITI